MLRDLLLEKQSAIAERWLEKIFQAYPAETRRVFEQGKDQFHNPVGHTLSRETGVILGLLLEGADTAKFLPHLDRILKIKAVQDFAPSQATSFLHCLKGVIRSELRREIRDSRLAVELMQFEDTIDALLMQAFDIYMNCREAICELRINEVKRRVSERLAGIGSEGPRRA